MGRPCGRSLCFLFLPAEPCVEQVLHRRSCDYKRAGASPRHLLSFLLWKHGTEAQGISEAFVLQNSCISEEERDAYEELLTQAEIQSTINAVNSKCRVSSGNRDFYMAFFARICKTSPLITCKTALCNKSVDASVPHRTGTVI